MSNYKLYKKYKSKSKYKNNIESGTNQLSKQNINTLYNIHQYGPPTRSVYIYNILNYYQNNHLDPNDPIDIIIESCKNILKTSDSYFISDNNILSQKLRMILNLINTTISFQRGRGSQKILDLRRMRDKLEYIDNNK